MEIEGTIVLVTGGANGLGLAISEYLSAKGAKVVVADLDMDALKILPDKIERYQMDVTKPADVKSVVEKIIKQHDRIDVLINNAGVIFSESFVDITNPDGIMHDYGRFKDSLTVNLDSVFIVTSAVVEEMVQRRIKGNIINISSISARGNEGQTAYSAAKAGVNAMTITWSKELARIGIRCNAIAPGFIGTDSTHAALSVSTVKHILSHTPLKRLGVPKEVAKAIVSIIENEFINGVILDVNGGLTI